MLDNAKLGIRGGWNMTLIWLKMARVEAYEASLPAATLSTIQAHRKAGCGKLSTFPLPSKYTNSMDRQLAALTSQQASWMVLQMAPLLRAAWAAAPERGGA